MPFRRDNSKDPRLIADLELLAGVREEAAAAPADGTDATGADAAGPAAAVTAPEPSPLDDPFVRRFVQVAAHGRRYAAYYAGAFAWLGVLLLMQPVGRSGTPTPPTDVRLATSADDPTAPSAALVTDAGTATDEGGTAFADTSFGGTAFTETELAGADSNVGEATFGPADPAPTASGSGEDTFGGASEAFPKAGDEADAATPPQPLSITRSGYASSTGGTLLEQSPPEDGLPVSAAAGQTNKASFIALDGDEVILRLKPVGSSTGSLNAERAGIRACRITQADWPAERGQAMAKAPAYAATDCATGTRAANGIWSFDLADFGDLDTLHGLALVPVPDPTLEFLVTFRPIAERA